MTVEIKSYLSEHFTKKEVDLFQLFLKKFETSIAYFPNLYPVSNMNILHYAKPF